ncbi:MAG TPA: cold shock domain-containing protein [Phnomibacter sp.]|nr:cold shock domain-containing protein [Phnomibacter sp.]
MAKSQQSWQKNEREKKKQKERQEKAERKAERKQSGGGKSLNDMMAYIDEFGNITDTPPDPSKRTEVKLEDIVIGVPKATEADGAGAPRTGVVTFFNSGKGFGFIKDQISGESVFVHINACADPIEENSKVQFEMEKSPRGWQAVNVSLVK